MSQAIVSTALVYAGLMALVFLAKRMGKQVSDFTELCNAFVLQTGFCWEMAIYVGLVDSTTKLRNPNSRRIAAIVWICFLLVMIIPAWFWYILPKAQKAADGKAEGDAAEGSAPKEAAPAAAAVPAAPAATTPATPATPAAPAAEEAPAPPATPTETKEEAPAAEAPAEEATTS